MSLEVEHKEPARGEKRSYGVQDPKTVGRDGIRSTRERAPCPRGWPTGTQPHSSPREGARAGAARGFRSSCDHASRESGKRGSPREHTSSSNTGGPSTSKQKGGPILGDK